MELKFVCPLIVVKDVSISKIFYEKILGQEVQFDFGENIRFKSPLSLHDQKHYLGLIGKKTPGRDAVGADNFELYFESRDIKRLEKTLLKENVEFVHGLREQPWGQRVVRFYDPDRHIIEIGEPMDHVVERLLRKGLSLDEVSRKTSLPPETVRTIKNNL